MYFTEEHGDGEAFSFCFAFEEFSFSLGFCATISVVLRVFVCHETGAEVDSMFAVFVAELVDGCVDILCFCDDEMIAKEIHLIMAKICEAHETDASCTILRVWIKKAFE